MRPLSILSVWSLLILLACGGEQATAPTETEPTETEKPPEEAPLLDFSAIAGEWVGTGQEANGITFWIVARLSSSARRGFDVGDIEYGPVNSESGDDTNPACEGDWHAGTADDPTYVVNEQIERGFCPDGRVELEYDSADETLDYHYVPADGNPNLEATAILTRP